MTAVDAARLQFALLAGTHFLFVLVTLGLGPVVAVLQTRWARTGRPVLERATRFWGQLYLVNYALGVAAGIVLELQLGLHFPGLLEVAGGVIGAPLVIESMGAFFLESTFLGIWVFGWHLLPRWLHTAAFWGVVVTGYLSAFTVMVANGFLRNPVGYRMVDGEARVADAVALVTNPAAVVSAAHALGACLMAGGFVLVGVSVWHLRRGVRGLDDGADDELWRLSTRGGLGTGTAGAVVAVVSGFAQFTYFRDVDAAREPVVGISYAAMDLVAVMTLLVGLALLGLLVRDALFRLWPRFRGGLFAVLSALVAVPFATALLGWVAREVGRQPWAIVGVLRTEDAVSDASAGAVLTSLVVLVGIMATLAVADALVLVRLARRGTRALVLGAVPAQVLGAGDPAGDRLVFGGAR